MDMPLPRKAIPSSRGSRSSRLDRRPFEAALAIGARRTSARDQAPLLAPGRSAAERRDAANAEYQQLTAERQAQLNARGIVAKDQVDQSRAQADATVRDRQGRPRGHRQRHSASSVAQEAAVDNARSLAQLHGDHVRRSTASTGNRSA